MWDSSHSWRDWQCWNVWFRTGRCHFTPPAQLKLSMWRTSASTAVLLVSSICCYSWFEASATMMTSALFWDIARRRVIIVYRRLRTTYLSHLHGWRIREAKDSWPLKMGPMQCPETSVNNYHTTPCNIPEERRCYSCCPHVYCGYLHVRCYHHLCRRFLRSFNNCLLSTEATQCITVGVLMIQTVTVSVTFGH
jgi:hypothetical protein